VEIQRSTNHKRNFVENVRETAWRDTNILRNLRRKVCGDMIFVSPLSEKVVGTCTRVPHLIAPMQRMPENNHIYFTVSPIKAKH